jgi:hypothetical protein
MRLPAGLSLLSRYRFASQLANNDRIEMNNYARSRAGFVSSCIACTYEALDELISTQRPFVVRMVGIHI